MLFIIRQVGGGGQMAADLMNQTITLDRLIKTHQLEIFFDLKEGGLFRQDFLDHVHSEIITLS